MSLGILALLSGVLVLIHTHFFSSHFCVNVPGRKVEDNLPPTCRADEVSGSPLRLAQTLYGASMGISTFQIWFSQGRVRVAIQFYFVKLYSSS